MVSSSQELLINALINWSSVSVMWVIRPFTNYLESIILQRERLFTSGKHSRQLSMSLQVYPKVKNPRATSETLQASVIMLNVKVQDSTIRKKLNKYGLFGRVAGKSLFFLKRTWQHSLCLQSWIWTNHKTSGTMSFGQTRPKWRCLVIMHSSTFGENQTQPMSTNTSYQLSCHYYSRFHTWTQKMLRRMCWQFGPDFKHVTAGHFLLQMLSAGCKCYWGTGL